MVECQMLEIQDDASSLVRQAIDELRKQRPQEEAAVFHKQIVEDLFERVSEEIARKQPKSVIQFMLDFLCEHYPEHLHGFARLWKSDPELEENRLKVLKFFHYYQLPVDVACHFTDAGFDTLDTIVTLNCDSLAEIEAYSKAQWLPGHKVRLQSIFQDIEKHVEEFNKEGLHAAVVL